MSLLLLLRNRTGTTGVTGVGGLTVTVTHDTPAAVFAGSPIVLHDGLGLPVDLGDPLVAVVVSGWHYVSVGTVTVGVARTDTAATVARTAGG